MHDIIEFFKSLLDAEKLALLVSTYGGLYLVALIVFAETGLFVGFFLPGDSLLFIAGFMVRQETFKTPTNNDFLNLLFWMTLITVAGIIGNMVGYWFGRKTGPTLFERRDTLLFKRRHIEQARDFYDQRGGTAIIVARFLPVVRTFAPIVAGVVAMDRKKFFFFNVIGSLAWVCSMMLAGYFLGGIPWVKENFEKIVIGIVIITTAPVLWKMIFSKKKPVLAAGADVVEEIVTPETKKDLQ